MSSLRLVTATTAANPNEHDLYLDDSGQLEWIGGDIDDKDDYARMVVQRIECRIKLVKGEWYLDQREGTPWHEQIWRKGATKETVEAVLRRVIKRTPGVLDVTSITVTLDSAARSAAITFAATTDMNTQVTSDLLDEPMIIEGFYG